MLVKSPYYTEKEAAFYLSVSVSKLRQDRMKGTGPRFHKNGRAVRYLISDLEQYMKERGYMSTIQHKMRSQAP